MESGIKDKVVAITGAGSGIGKATAIMLAGRGAKVVLGARREDHLKIVADQIIENGGEAVFAVADVKSRNDLNNLVQLACEKYGRLDVIVNNAGITQLSRIDELHVEDWEDMIDVNLKGVLYGIAAALPIFRNQGSGHVINIISTSGIKITPLQGIYAGTKNAVRTITEALRQEGGNQLRVTGISPGFVKTDLVNNMKNLDSKAFILEKMDDIGLSPDAVAGAVLYAIEQPADVEVGDIVIRPTVQD
jgi:NADP-dependent 3-hydroxy acid dehydrogenase YdfG